jgi:excisionase family DNA binding protein
VVRSLPPDTIDRFISINQAAAYMSCHPDTIRRWIKRGILPYFRQRRLIRIRLSDLLAVSALSQ